MQFHLDCPYDGVGNLTRKTTPEAQTIDYLYDSTNKRTKQDASDDVQWYYDDVANVTKLRLSRDNGSNWDDNVYQYEQRNRLTKITLPDSKTLTYYYNGIGARTKMTDVASNNITYLYDNVHRLTNVAKGGSAHASYYYDDAGRRTKLLLGNSTYAAYLYDNANRLTSLHNKKSNATVISSFAYLLDDVGNRTKMTLAGGDYVQYLYDSAWQLTKEERKNSGDTTQYYNQFVYDGVGNRTKLYYYDGQNTVTTNYLYNSANQLTQDADGTTTNTYTYDDNGNLTRKNDGASNFDYFWDDKNRLTKYDAPGANNDGTYVYDNNWRRMTTTVGGTTTAFFYDRADVVGEYGSGAWQRTYVTPGLDQNVSITSGGSTYHYHQDGLGSVRNLTDSGENVQNTYQYFAFGSVYGNPTENITQPFRFTGRRWDGERSEYFYRYRNYRPTMGRFQSRDPDWQEDMALTSVYQYVRNKPTLWTDPLGLRTFTLEIFLVFKRQVKWKVDEWSVWKNFRKILDTCFKQVDPKCDDKVQLKVTRSKKRRNEKQLGLRTGKGQKKPTAWLHEVFFKRGRFPVGAFSYTEGPKTSVSLSNVELKFAAWQVQPPEEPVVWANILAHEILYLGIWGKSDPKRWDEKTPGIYRPQVPRTRVEITDEMCRALKKKLKVTITKPK